MLLEYYGHSCFAFTDSAGRRLMVDPYGPEVGYRLPHREADVTLVSHAHFDHDHLPAVRGRTAVVRGGGQRQAAGLDIRGIMADHDAEGGSRLGHVTLYRFEMDGLAVAHLSDLGAPLTRAWREALGPVDVLLVPCGGGGYTLGSAEAAALARDLAPRWVVPMHYRTPFLNRTRFPELEPLEAFLAHFGAKSRRETEVRLDAPTGGGPEVLALAHLF